MTSDPVLSWRKLKKILRDTIPHLSIDKTKGKGGHQAVILKNEKGEDVDTYTLPSHKDGDDVPGYIKREVMRRYNLTPEMLVSKKSRKGVKGK